MSDTKLLREHLYGVVMERVDQNAERRQEALTEYLLVTATAGEAAADRIAELVPPVLPELYAKWVNMFLDRLFETVPLEQIRLFSDGTEENNAAVVLAYLMFLESERMERQVEEDLRSSGLEVTGGESELGADFVRSRMAEIADDMQRQREAKAEAYRKQKAN
ncbi:MAG: hypothetical protein V3573_11115 [Desulfovibrionaceae bacterium]